MSQYSFEGYLSALEMRSTRTLLLEGPSDQQIITRVLNSLVEAGRVVPDSVVIDHADLIDRTGLYMGVREFVEHVHSKSTAPTSQFFVLVDREFRGFELGPPPSDRLNGHHRPGPNCLWTRGHSVENYMFSAEPVIEYLRHHHPETVPPATYSAVERTFEAAITWCGALSLALLEAALIGRADGLCRIEHWNCGTQELNVVDLANALACRCAASFSAEDFSARVRYWQSELRNAAPELARWIAHGHIANSLLWASVGQTLANLGIDAVTVEQVASGMRLNKLRMAARWWYHQIEKNTPEAPLPLLDWLTQHESEMS